MSRVNPAPPRGRSFGPTPLIYSQPRPGLLHTLTLVLPCPSTTNTSLPHPRTRPARHVRLAQTLHTQHSTRAPRRAPIELKKWGPDQHQPGAPCSRLPTRTLATWVHPPAHCPPASVYGERTYVHRPRTFAAHVRSPPAALASTAIRAKRLALTQALPALVPPSFAGDQPN